MNLNLVQFSGWDEVKIEKFIHFKKSLQENLATYFPETVDEYKKLLHPDSPFAKDYQWSGFIVYQEKKIVAKAILAWRNGSKVGNLGFIDWENDLSVASALTNKVEAYAKTMGLKEIKTPVDINFFVKYRIKCPGGGAPYFGEPIYPDYYHELFAGTGYQVVGTWEVSDKNG